MELRIIDSNKAAKNIQVSERTFGDEYNEALIHQVVTACRAGLRAGTKAQKTRAEVSGGGAKPWRQKGTGRARAGTIRSPIWRSGGVTFAAKPRSYSQKVNKKMYQGALRSILSELVRQDRLVVVDNLSVDSPKTKAFVEKLKAFDLQNVLIVTDKIDPNLQLATRNLHQVALCLPREISPLNLIAFDKVLLTVSALKQCEEWLG